MLHLSDLPKKIDEAAEEMHHLTQDDKDRRPQPESFVKTILMMMMNGMMISIMKILLLMMILLCQQNYRLPHGRHHTSCGGTT
jgi:hypothetical protein